MTLINRQTAQLCLAPLLTRSLIEASGNALNINTHIDFVRRRSAFYARLAIYIVNAFHYMQNNENCKHEKTHSN